jgi:hypothetical protein
MIHLKKTKRKTRKKKREKKSGLYFVKCLEKEREELKESKGWGEGEGM